MEPKHQAFDGTDCAAQAVKVDLVREREDGDGVAAVVRYAGKALGCDARKSVVSGEDPRRSHYLGHFGRS